MAFQHPGKQFELAALRAAQYKREQRRDTGMSTVDQGVASTSVGPGYNMNHNASEFAHARQKNSGFFGNYVNDLLRFDQYLGQGANPPSA
jgi:hypothetical protein